MSKKKMDSYAHFLEAEKRTIKSTKKHYAKEISIYVECFNLLVQTIDHIAERSVKVKPPLGLTESAILFNAARILSSMRVYIDLVMKGYYFDAHIIRRSLYESVLLIDSFTRDKKYVDKWVDKELKLSQVKKEVGFYGKEILERFYEEMSDYVHSNIPAVLTLVELEPPARMHAEELWSADVHTRPSFESERISTGSVFPIMGYLTLGLLLRFFGNKMKPKTRSKIYEALRRWKTEVERLLDEDEKRLRNQKN